MIIRGGENVYPREIEEFLYTHPDIEDAQVIGVPSERYGEEVMAWVRPRPGRGADPAGPRRLTVADRSPRSRSRGTGSSWRAFPLTVTGKVQKFKMREIAAADLENESHRDDLDATRE